LSSGEFNPKASVQTISNAMDVGNPSNFQRMADLYGSEWEKMKQDIEGYSFSDAQTRDAIKEVHDKYGYVIDPHGAVGYLALKQFQKKQTNTNGIILETAHPAKFLPVMEPILGRVEVPERLALLADKPKVATSLSSKFEDFKAFVL